MYDKQSPYTIQSMFDNIAKRYDRTNAVLSFNLHKRWNKHLANLVGKKKDSLVYFDLCAGTGDIAKCYLEQAKDSCSAHLIDFSKNMLECAKRKMAPFEASHHLSYIQADVQDLPYSSAYADACTMAYGIRNVKEPEKAVKEVCRVLKPGGVFGILELTRPKSRLIKPFHQFYLKTILPVIGKKLTEDQEAYRYLCDSIHRFLPADKLAEILKQAGFGSIEIKPLSFGIASIVYGKKPL